MDLNNLSLKELKNLQGDVEKAIASYENRMKKEALSEIEAKAKAMGFTLAELLGTTSKKRSSGSVAPKYAHPENPSMTWTGRGRKPKWIEEALASGKSLADLAI